MVELDAPGQATLGDKAQGRDGELIKLVVTGLALAVSSQRLAVGGSSQTLRGRHGHGSLDSCRCSCAMLQAPSPRPQGPASGLTRGIAEDMNSSQRTSLGTRCISSVSTPLKRHVSRCHTWRSATDDEDEHEVGDDGDDDDDDEYNSQSQSVSRSLCHSLLVC